MQGTKPDIFPLLERLNGPAMAHWLVEYANRRGVPCGRSAEEKWRRNWRVWSEFCALTGVAAFPIERSQVEAFLVDCGVRGRRRDTVAGYLNTLRLVIASVDGADPMDTEEGKAALQRLMVMYFPEQPTEATPGVAPTPESPAPLGAAPVDVKPARPAEALPDRPSMPRAAASTSKPPSSQSPAAASGSRNPQARLKPPQPYELPEDYGRLWWTHKMRIKEQARAVWAARYAMRQRTPERFKLLSLVVRELELAEKGYSEIAAAVLRGCIGGAGGFRSVADRIGVPAESLRAAFARDEVPQPGVIRKLLAHLLTGGGSLARHEAPGRCRPDADLSI